MTTRHTQAMGSFGERYEKQLSTQAAEYDRQLASTEATVHALQSENEVWKERTRTLRTEHAQLEKERNEVS